MDVSIAVSLIRGQMGTVVERAVNGAVETVLAEMLKVVGVKFEELKSQVVLLKRDISALQREKALKEKENDNIRAKLRYTELKLKYYRQGVEEELQQRASAATLVRLHPSNFLQTHRTGVDISPTEPTPKCLSQSRTTERALMKRNQECTSPQSTSRRTIRVRCNSDYGVSSTDSSDLQLPVILPVSTPAESLESSSVLFSPTEPDAGKSKDDQDECQWTLTLQPTTECVDTVGVPPLTVENVNLSSGQQPTGASNGSSQADLFMLPSHTTQVKQEAQEQQEQEVICIKEEPEEEQEVTATLLLDCQVEQNHHSESEMQTATEWPGLPLNNTNHTTAMSSAGPSTYPLRHMVTSIPSMVTLQPGIPSRQAVRPWTKDLSPYEEYKLRRNELRRRNLNRRRELERSLPQPLLADLVRERREKTRLRVARWRAKRKLQACLNQVQTQGVAPGVSQTGFSISSQHEIRLPCASTSNQQRQSSSLSSRVSTGNLSATLPFKTSTCSSNVLLQGPNNLAHEHTVTSSSAYSQVSLSQQSITLGDADFLQ